MTALKDLLAKVEAGLDTAHDHARAFPSESAYGHCTWHDSHKASGGSLDAAKALHDAVLPGWSPSIGQNVHHCYWFAHLLRADNGSIVGDYEWSAIDNPARAWLSAILHALIAQEEGA